MIHSFEMLYLSKKLLGPLIPTYARAYYYTLRLFTLGILIGLFAPHPLVFVLLVTLFVIQNYLLGGTYNGGSDYMFMQLLLCHTGILLFSNNTLLVRGFFIFLCIQVILSYLIAGWVKLKNAEWREASAIYQIFNIQKYAVPAQVKSFFTNFFFLKMSAAAIILFELIFWTGFVHPNWALVLITCGALFHLANFLIFGLNRFFWAWIASYPLIYAFFTFRF